MWDLGALVACPQLLQNEILIPPECFEKDFFSFALNEYHDYFQPTLEPDYWTRERTYLQGLELHGPGT